MIGKKTLKDIRAELKAISDGANGKTRSRRTEKSPVLRELEHLLRLLKAGSNIDNRGRKKEKSKSKSGPKDNDGQKVSMTLKYKGFFGVVAEARSIGFLHGHVVNTRDVITFQGSNVKELRKAFHDSVDDYLDFCQERGEEPDKPYSGQFVLRVGPDLHRKISNAASLAGKSLNAWASEKLEVGIQQLERRMAVGRKK